MFFRRNNNMYNSIQNKPFSEKKSNIESKIRILIADDHKLIRVGLKSLFSKHEDMTVVSEAENGKDAVEKIKTQHPDVAILDLVLGDINGIDVVKKISDEITNTKIIILTSHIKDSDVTDSLKAGVNAYVLKDIKSDILVMIVRTINEGAMWIDPKAVSVLRNSQSASVIPQKTCSRANFRAQHANLTEREYEVLKLVVEGKSNLEIAKMLHISEHTSKAHVCNIIQKLVVDDRTQAAVKAIKEGLV